MSRPTTLMPFSSSKITFSGRKLLCETPIECKQLMASATYLTHRLVSSSLIVSPLLSPVSIDSDCPQICKPFYWWQKCGKLCKSWCVLRNPFRRHFPHISELSHFPTKAILCIFANICLKQ